MPGIQQISCLCENGPLFSSSEHRQLSCGLLALNFVKREFTFLVLGKAMISIKPLQRTGISVAALTRVIYVASR